MRLLVVALALSACVTAVPMPSRYVELGPAPRPGPWRDLHDVLAACTYQQGIAGELRVRIEIDDDGGAGTVTATRGGSELTSCIGQSLVATRFPRNDRGRAIDVPYVASARM